VDPKTLKIEFLLVKTLLLKCCHKDL
jgi:hypothetical protein